MCNIGANGTDPFGLPCETGTYCCRCPDVSGHHQSRRGGCPATRPSGVRISTTTGAQSHHGPQEVQEGLRLLDRPRGAEADGRGAGDVVLAAVLRRVRDAPGLGDQLHVVAQERREDRLQEVPRRLVFWPDRGRGADVLRRRVRRRRGERDRPVLDPLLLPGSPRPRRRQARRQGGRPAARPIARLLAQALRVGRDVGGRLPRAPRAAARPAPAAAAVWGRSAAASAAGASLRPSGTHDRTCT